VSLVFSSTLITQQLSSVALFVAMFILLYQERLQAETLANIDTVFLMFGYIVWMLGNAFALSKEQFLKHGTTILILKNQTPFLYK
jgi:sugar (pentulose or hexulose) kinase